MLKAKVIDDLLLSFSKVNCKLQLFFVHLFLIIKMAQKKKILFYSILSTGHIVSKGSCNQTLELINKTIF